MTAQLPQSLAALLSPRAYPHPVDRVEVIETHISWVVLAGAFAYKIKRPVRYPFVDQRALERRRLLCEEELRLNRRFAPELYVDVCRIVPEDGAARMCGEGSALEYAVRMRRFERADELDRLLESWRIEPHELEAFGRELAVIHAGLPAAAEGSPWGRPEDIRGAIVRNLGECAQASAQFGRADEVIGLHAALERRVGAAEPWMSARRAAGRIRECHGDLHCRNVVRIGSRLVAFDCLEFDPALRWIDVAEELAALLSDLLARNRPVRAQAFRGGYLGESADYAACRLLKLYQAHRALVRAKVAALAAAGRPQGIERRALDDEHGRLVGCAAAALEEGAEPPRLVLMSGLSGSGKTWLARLLAPRLAAVHLRSDIERKRLAGLGALARSHSDVAQGLYAPQRSRAVYGQLARAAEHVLAGGFTAIVDAAFLNRAQRAEFIALSRRRAAPLLLVFCEAPEAVLRARVAERGRRGLDASEARDAVLDWQIAHLEVPSAEDGIPIVRVASADASSVDRVVEQVRSLR